MESIADLTTGLLRYRRAHPDTPLVIFKSDVSAAYRRLPLHPLWQIKQIVTIDGERHVDRSTSFGGRGSCRDWTAFMGLVLWIATFIKFLTDLFGYIDDGFSFDEGDVVWYEPYHCYYPSKQTKLLQLWDEIGLSHEKYKQEYGPELRVIGFLVNANLMQALAVVSVVEAVTRLSSVPNRLLVFTDNTNTVDIFHSLRSMPPYNGLLKFTVSLLLEFDISLRVVHIPGIDNVIANSLSRFENTKAVAACPGLSISHFQPPRVTLGQPF